MQYLTICAALALVFNFSSNAQAVDAPIGIQDPVAAWVKSLSNMPSLRLVYEFQSPGALKTTGPVVFASDGSDYILWRNDGGKAWIANAYCEKKYYYIEGVVPNRAIIYNSASSLKPWNEGRVAPAFATSRDVVMENPLLKPIEFYILGVLDQKEKRAIETVKHLRWSDIFISGINNRYIPYLNEYDSKNASKSFILKQNEATNSSNSSSADNLADIPHYVLVMGVQSGYKVVTEARVELPWVNESDKFIHNKDNDSLVYSYKYEIISGVPITSEISIKTSDAREAGKYILVSKSFSGIKNIAPLTDVSVVKNLEVLLDEAKDKYDVLGKMPIDE